MKVRAVPTPLSPVLANVYLHYVLDLWFENVVKLHCRGEAWLSRFADEWVCAEAHKRTQNGSIGCYQSGWRNST